MIKQVERAFVYVIPGQ